MDESVWLDTFYYPVVTPLFFVETLADLEKEVKDGRTPEQVVGNLAEKTPTGGQVNVYHGTLVAHEIMGQPVEMRNVPIVAGGIPVETGGRRGLVFNQPPEAEAFNRWQDGKFLDVERNFARNWRKGLDGLDLGALYRQGKAIIGHMGRPRDLAEAKAMAVTLLDREGSRAARAAFQGFSDPEVSRKLLARWKAEGEPPLTRYAPYTAHMMTVDLFFCIGMGADLISRDRPSNKMDMAYLYYLPFCMAFTSNDNLHARTVPLFLSEEQVYIPGTELKADLAALDAYYSAFPAEVKERGIMSFAFYPPTERDFLTSRLWDKLMAPGWRESATRPRAPMSKEAEKKLIENIKDMKSDAPRARGRRAGSEKADAILFERRVPVRRGKWRLLPPGVENEGTPGQ